MVPRSIVVLAELGWVGFGGMVVRGHNRTGDLLTAGVAGTLSVLQARPGRLRQLATRSPPDRRASTRNPETARCV